jgi:hypothetical protein
VPSKKCKKPDPSPAWLAIETALMEFRPKGKPSEDAFTICRIAHGLMGQHDIDPQTIDPVKAARRIYANLTDHCREPFDGVAEAVEWAWPKVVVPEGWNIIQWAVKRFRWVKRPKIAPGRYATPKQREIATMLWYVFDYLPVDEKGLKFASCRDLAKHTGEPQATVGRIIHKLEHANVLRRAEKGSTASCARFEQLKCPWP